MRTADKAPIFQPLLDQSLCLFHREVADMHVVNQWKVNVARIADSCFGGQLRHVIDAHLEQIAGAQPQQRRDLITGGGKRVSCRAALRSLCRISSIGSTSDRSLRERLGRGQRRHAVFHRRGRGACCAQPLNSKQQMKTSENASRLRLRAKLNLPNSIKSLWEMEEGSLKSLAQPASCRSHRVAALISRKSAFSTGFSCQGN